MKIAIKATLLIGVLFLPYYSNAQKIRFTDTSNVWFFDYGNQTVFGVKTKKTVGDTIIKGKTYRKMYVNAGLTSHPDLIREDTIAKKVYVYMDSVDILLYDFSQKVGDTFISKAPFKNGRHILMSIDSIKIDSFWYKTITYQPVNSANGFSYSVIENIGCYNGLGFPYWNYVTVEYYERLKCFYHKNRKVVFPATSNINADSCYEFTQYVSVNNLDSIIKHNVIISPHPITMQTVMSLPYTMTSGKLVVVNSVGQLIIEKEIVDSKKIVIGALLNNKGIYYYRLTDKIKENVFSGKIVKE